MSGEPETVGKGGESSLLRTVLSLSRVCAAFPPHSGQTLGGLALPGSLPWPRPSLGPGCSQVGPADSWPSWPRRPFRQRGCI